MQRSRLPLGILLVFLVLLLNLLAALPSLHECFHADAGKAEHQCAVTLFAHGNVDSASAEIPIPVPVDFVAVRLVFDFPVFSPAIEHLPAGRAPPVSAFNS